MARYNPQPIINGESGGGYALAVSTSNASLSLPAGTYRVWIKSRTAATSVFCRLGAAATVPADATVDDGVFGFAGDETIIIEIARATTLQAILPAAAASDTLYATLV